MIEVIADFIIKTINFIIEKCFIKELLDSKNIQNIW